MKTTKIWAILVLALGFLVCPVQGTLTLPFEGSANSSGPVFKITNTNMSTAGTIVWPGAPIPDIRCGGMFEALGPFGTGVFGYGKLRGVLGKSDTGQGVTGTTDTNIGVEGIATNNGDVTNYGGYFTAAGRSGIGVYGEASSTLEERRFSQTYGGYFVSETHFLSSMGRAPIGTGIYAKGSKYAAELDGKVKINGNVTIKNRAGTSTVIELGEGLDYAEGFDVSDNKQIAAGSVLIIDADNPGKLAISNKAYDSKVAGIVAGAKGQGSGVRLGGDQFDCDVALAGRVYCNVDATEVAVEPGDLLTTSATPGYAMKAVDYMRAQGAILGKAMEKLEKGKKGQILVLVTLQ
jgi:hypothetical protein